MVVISGTMGVFETMLPKSCDDDVVGQGSSKIKLRAQPAAMMGLPIAANVDLRLRHNAHLEKIEVAVNGKHKYKHARKHGNWSLSGMLQFSYPQKRIGCAKILLQGRTCDRIADRRS